MHIFLKLEPYLQQWCRHFYGEVNGALSFPKGSVENKLLRVFLRKPRVGESPLPESPEAMTPVRVPSFQGHNPDSENYFSPAAQKALRCLISDRFDVDLWLSIGGVAAKGETRKSVVEAWMEARGIEVDLRNFETISKRLQRLSNRHSGVARQKRFRTRHGDGDTGKNI